MCDACRNKGRRLYEAMSEEQQRDLQQYLTDDFTAQAERQVHEAEDEIADLEAWKNTAIGCFADMLELIDVAELTSDTTVANLGDKIVAWKQLDNELTKVYTKLDLR